jgi:hypothetical protein
MPHVALLATKQHNFIYRQVPPTNTPLPTIIHLPAISPPSSPRYFSLTTGAACVLLGTLVMGGAPLSSQPAITLSVAAGANILNWLFIEPKTTALMFERYAIENKEVGDSKGRGRRDTARILREGLAGRVLPEMDGTWATPRQCSNRPHLRCCCCLDQGPVHPGCRSTC